MRRVLIATCGALVLLSACGSAATNSSRESAGGQESGSEPSDDIGVELPAPSTSLAPTSVAVPPKQSADDSRTALERYIGVPPNPDEAAQWSQELHELAIADCMEKAGFQYAVWPVSGAEADPNIPYLETLTPEAHEAFMSLRYGVPKLPPGGETCDVIGADRVFVLNAFEDEYAPNKNRIAADETLSAASTSVLDCIGATGQDSDSADAATIDQCQESVGWSDIATDVGEAIDAEFIREFVADLDDFVSNRPEGR